ncbi:MAG: TatD family hydrolase [Clostridiales bacterium]|nr:TatD family hydrolase [Clostridiales bacterium]
MYFDTHAHYDDTQFDEDRDLILSKMPHNGIDLIVNPGSNVLSSEASVELAQRYSFIWAAAGIHPHEAKQCNPEALQKIKELCLHEKVVAIGEIGLDYHYDHSPRDIQKMALYAQLELAASLDLPVILHDREAHEDCLTAVRAFPGIKGVFHCYSGSLEMAKQIIKMGWYLSFTGSITFKNARKAPEIVAWVPSDRIMIETDAPYMAPVPNRGKRNDSANLYFIAQAVGEMRGITVSEAAELTLKNGKRFFGV